VIQYEKKQTSFTIEEELILKLKHLALDKGMSYTALVNKYLKKGLSDEKIQKKETKEELLERLIIRAL
jgi:predicted DNA binding CopG/RHH family protein